MIKSMTGFGRAEGDSAQKKISVQIKTLNSKQLDFTLRSPQIYKDRELDFRSKIVNALERGKVELSIQFENVQEESNWTLNKPLFTKYYEELKGLLKEMDTTTDLVPVIAKFPDVLGAKKEEANEEDWRQIEDLMQQAIDALNEFRVQEGAVLAEDFSGRIKTIQNLLSTISEFEQERMDQIRKRIEHNLSTYVNSEKLNQDRLEQEMIYYLEKIDITEEKTRLLSHCDYFLATMKNDVSQGRKLAFISQEIGREINTIGSKANHAGMQKRVVQMKDELEKIKEQLLNVL